jgi:hypothetical protein
VLEFLDSRRTRTTHMTNDDNVRIDMSVLTEKIEKRLLARVDKSLMCRRRPREEGSGSMDNFTITGDKPLTDVTERRRSLN